MSKADPGKKRRWILWALVGGIAIVLVAGLTLPLLIDAERFRPQIEQVLRDTTGWDAQLGAVDLSVFRGALSVSPASLSAPGGATSKIEIGRIDVKVGLFALLRKELRVESIRLVRPEILLVRPDAATGWVIPVATTTEGGSESAESSADGNSPTTTGGSSATADPSDDTDGAATEAEFAVVIEEIGVRDGRLRLEDHALTPPITLEITGFTSTYYPSDGGITGQLTFGTDEGEARWRGQVGKTIEVTLDGFKTELLQTFLGQDLIHAGGRLSGEVTIETPLRVEGTLTAKDLTLVSGERPFDDAGLDFVVSPLELGWQLERLEFRGDGARLVGGGPLTPVLALKLEFPDTDLEAFLRASESVLPVPLEVLGPGNVEATIRADQPEGGSLTYEASGSLSAAEVRPGEMLPAMKDVQATFVLNRAGRLDVQVENGTIAGGPVNGNATIDPVNPPGELKFSGGLQDAVFGQLLGGLVADAAPVRGPTGFDAALGVDLTREVLDARSLSGRINFGARELSMPGWNLDSAVRGKLEQKGGSGSAGLLKGLLDKDSGKSDVSADEVVDAVEKLIDSLEGTLDLDRWPWGLDNVKLGVGDLESDGSGWFDPEQGTVDFTLTSRLNVDESKKLLDKYSLLSVLADRSGRITLPVHVNGSLFAPSIQVELEKALKGNALGGSEKQDDVKSLLKGLLDRKKK